MRLPPAPLRFVMTLIALWIGGRVLVLLPRALTAIAGESTIAMAWPGDLPAWPFASEPASPPSLRVETRQAAPARRIVRPAPPPPFLVAAASDERDEARMLLQLVAGGMPQTYYRHSALLAETVPYPVVPTATAARRWSGSAWVFVRGGSSRSLAAGGQLGGGQAGARIAYRVEPGVAIAARVNTPLTTQRGTEGALGIDLMPLKSVPFRLSAERRFDLGGDGRNAWAAYAAGGFYRAIGEAIELDGYAQAGVVGARRRDLFVDGAVRLNRRIDGGNGRVVRAGGGIWAAAQPGAARIDVGPRIALSVPTGATILTAALEGRAKIAGDARPGSTVALTLAADF